jgi:OFA family oxalate/formate antiporter-like MFS transporter
MKTNRWFILFLSVLINLCIGAGYAWSVFQTPLMEMFGWKTSEASLAFSIAFAVTPIAMIIFGPLQDKYGPRWVTFGGGIAFGLGMFLTGTISSLTMLYLSYGVVVGFGIGMAYGCTTASAVKWFPDKRGLAGGLTAAGFGLGAVVLAPLASALIINYDVLFAFRSLGIALGILISIGALFLSVPQATMQSSTSTQSVGDGSMTRGEMLKTTDFYILWAIYVAGCFSGMMILGHASPIACETLEITPQAAALLVSVVAIANTSGRLFWGWISDRIGQFNTIIAMFCASILGMILLYFSESLKGISVLGLILIPLSFGGFLGVFPSITAQRWGARNAGSNYGVLFTAFGLAAVLGPRIASTVKEGAGGEYAPAFLISAIISVIGTIIVFYYTNKMKKNAVVE